MSSLASTIATIRSVTSSVSFTASFLPPLLSSIVSSVFVGWWLTSKLTPWWWAFRLPPSSRIRSHMPESISPSTPHHSSCILFVKRLVLDLDCDYKTSWLDFYFDCEIGRLLLKCGAGVWKVLMELWSRVHFIEFAGIFTKLCALARNHCIAFEN